MAALLALAGCSQLSSCGSGSQVDNPLNCFPADARPWIHVASDPAAASPAVAAPGAATVYVDRSGSMVGYLAGATPTERPLQDLIGNLTAMLNRQGLGTRFKAFGTQITPFLGEPEQGALMRPGYYSCTGEYAEGCDNRESHLDNVFREIAADRNAVAVVISDLWFSNSDVQTTALSELAAPLTAILASERAVAIYGIPAPFDGRIYDLPYTSGSLPFRGRHPLFAIVVGSDDQVAAFHDAWMNAPSPYLANELGAARIQRTLFTLQPSRRTEALAEPLAAGDDPRVVATPVLEAMEGIRLQEFAIDRSDAMRIVEPEPAPPSWTGPSAASFIPDSVWQGRYRPSVRVWERRSDSCTDEDWLEGRPVEGLWSEAPGGSSRFSLAPEAVAAELGREGTYLLVAELVRTELQTPNPASAWIRQWSFTPADDQPGRTGADGAPFFPTLHLGEVARLLEDALVLAARRQPRPIHGFAIVVKIDG